MSRKPLVYDYDVDLDSDTAPARVIRMVPEGSKVLEIGAGPGSITRHLVETRGCDVTALEIDPDAVERLRSLGVRVYKLDLNDPAWCDHVRSECGEFDCVIAADVLEHVYDPWRVLGEMKSLLVDSGSIILSIPHVGHASVVACLLDEDFEYWPWGLLDRTHVRFFGIKNMQALVNGAGLAISEAEFVVRTPSMTEFAERWSRIPEDIRSAVQRNRYSHVLQVVVRCTPAADGETGIDLMGLTPQSPNQIAVEHWTRVMKRQKNDRWTDLRSPIEGAAIAEPRSTFSGRIRRAVQKLRRK